VRETIKDDMKVGPGKRNTVQKKEIQYRQEKRSTDKRNIV